MRDYFCDNPVYTDFQFRTRFRMQNHLFLRIVNDLENQHTYFQKRVDATGRAGFLRSTNEPRRYECWHMVCLADLLDKVVRMGKSTILKCVRKFVKAINEVYGPTYLRKPNANDGARLLRIGEARGFPSMMGSIDCMHWEWKNCPVAWHGAYTRGDIGSPTIMLEAVASQDLWIWHAFFSVTGQTMILMYSNNHHYLHNTCKDKHLPSTVNGRDYDLGYYLADGIYPQWAASVKTISTPRGDKEKLFAQHQEGARKDVERAFGVLQSRFGIIHGLTKIWDTPTIKNIMYACIILHNMIVEDERDQYARTCEYEGIEGMQSPTMDDVCRGAPPFLTENIL